MNEWINSLLDATPMWEAPRENVNTELDSSMPTQVEKTKWWYDFSSFQEFAVELAWMQNISQSQLIAMMNAKAESMWMSIQEMQEKVAEIKEVEQPKETTDNVLSLLDEIESEIDWGWDITEQDVEEFMQEHEWLIWRVSELEALIEELQSWWPQEIIKRDQTINKLEQMLIDANNKLADIKYSDPFEDTDEAKIINLHRQHKTNPRESTTMALVMTMWDYLNSVTNWKIDSSKLLMMVSWLQWRQANQPMYNNEYNVMWVQQTTQPKNSINDLA